MLEHIYDFNKLIPKLKLLLKKNGKIIIEIPNYHSFWREILKGKSRFLLSISSLCVFKTILTKQFKIHKLKIIKVNFVEPPIFGSYFSSLGINRSLSKFLSIILYPLQFIISKFNSSSEGIFLF